MDMDSIPRLAAGCRLHPTESLLLIPEGTLKLQGPAREILSNLDGRRTVGAVVDLLHSQYAEADKEELRRDILALLERMQQRGVIRV
jgi:pyrroloquinoline quinone biosynthesis protein D